MTDTARQPSSAKPPGPKDHPIYGGLAGYHEDPIAFLEHNAATYGDVSAFRFFHFRCGRSTIRTMCVECWSTQRAPSPKVSRWRGFGR